MGKLPAYKTLKEKSKYFLKGSRCINTKKEFDLFWERLHNLDDQRVYRFRGVGEARYKLFTSAQRFWKERELIRQDIAYHDFVQRLLDHTMHWNESTITRFFAQSNISQNNTLAYLSYMQHYGMPTPLLDFTANPFTGLYFAVNSNDFDPSDRLIDNYCSLYIVDTTNPYFVDSIQQFDQNIASTPDEAIEYGKHLLSYAILFVSTDNAAYKILNNLNILNQRGVFFFSSDAKLSVEEVYQRVMQDFMEQLGSELFQQSNYQEYFAECANLHKSLRPYALAKLRSEGITPDFIFPDVQDLRESVMARVLSEH